MDFSELTGVFLRLEETTKRLEMTDIVAEFLGSTPEHKLPSACLLLRGRVFPQYSDKEIGIAEKLMIKAIAKVSGATEKKINDALRETGDMGLTAERILKSKAQTTLVTKELTVRRVHENLAKLADLEGKGSQERKLGFIT